MTSTNTQNKVEMSSFLSGKFHHVDVDRIEKELIELWQMAGKGADDGEPSVTRACSITFILFSRDGNAEFEAGNLLEEITITHPCRAILALALPAKKESLEAWVTARCRMIPGKKDKQICCEQITVRWQGEGTRNLASVVSPLQLVDLPTWLWWQNTRPVIEMLGPFFPFVERLIIDSALSNNQPGHMFDLRDVMQRMKDGGLLFDLNWRRLLPWRQTVARAFDESFGLLSLEDLDLISSVTIGVSAGKSGKEKQVSMQSVLFASWLASRLTWKLLSVERVSSDEVKLSFKLSRKKIDVTLKSVPHDEIEAGNLCYMTADFVGRSGQSLIVMQKHGCPGLEASLGEKSSVDPQSLCAVQKTSSQLVVDVLDNPATAELYTELLDVACDICGALNHN